MTFTSTAIMSPSLVALLKCVDDNKQDPDMQDEIRRFNEKMDDPKFVRGLLQACLKTDQQLADRARKTQQQDV